MVGRAITIGQRIGVAATTSTTLKPTIEMVEFHVRALAKDLEVEYALCEEAYVTYLSGNLSRHDRIVEKAVENLLLRNDMILLAQVSMALLRTVLD
jgi:hypothetical protein